MKKIIVFIILIVCSLHAFSQNSNYAQRKEMAKPVAVSTQAKFIPAPRAITIRKNTVQLKLQLKQFSDSVTIVKSDIDAMVDQMKNNLDSMSEMGETESMRLQMAMDRLSKMMTTLSNLLKKISDTSQSITQNLK